MGSAERQPPETSPQHNASGTIRFMGEPRKTREGLPVSSEGNILSSFVTR
jgi:hypothetical protein